MERFRFVIERWADREFEIHRKCAHDPAFAAICADFEEASRALEHWGKKGLPGVRHVENYRNLLEELAAEIQAHLSAHHGGRP